MPVTTIPARAAHAQGRSPSGSSSRRPGRELEARSDRGCSRTAPALPFTRSCARALPEVHPEAPGRAEGLWRVERPLEDDSVPGRGRCTRRSGRAGITRITTRLGTPAALAPPAWRAVVLAGAAVHGPLGLVLAARSPRISRNTSRATTGHHDRRARPEAAAAAGAGVRREVDEIGWMSTGLGGLVLSPELLDEELGVEPELLGVGAQEALHVGRSREQAELLVLERAQVLRADLGRLPRASSMFTRWRTRASRAFPRSPARPGIIASGG